MKLRILFPGLMIILSMLACNFPVSAPATETPTLFLLSPTATLSLSTPLPTQTLPPTNTPPPPTTSSPSVPIAFPQEVNVNCRLGPGTAWVPLSALTVGQNSQISGKTTDASWWNIVDPLSPGRKCWVSASVVNTAGNLAGIPVVEIPTASVTYVTVRTNPNTISGTGCASPAIEINGTIETNGPTQVGLRFEAQQGGAMPNQTAMFETFGEREFSVDYTPTVTVGTYWVRLVVTSPNSTQAEASYKIECP